MKDLIRLLRSLWKGRARGSSENMESMTAEKSEKGLKVAIYMA